MPKSISQSGSLSLSSDPVDVERLLTSLESILGASCLDTMTAFHLRCAVVEVVNNCIQHAYSNQPGQPIEISYDLGVDRVQIAVADRGPEFLGSTEASAAEIMSESGRGLQIINAWVSTLRFERNDGWNVCRLEQWVTK
jgi:anti-sigma regulatory factor (Ser/Thr protein kinase)